MTEKIPAPNYTQCPNLLFDEYMQQMGESELKVVLAAIRKTFGYHKQSDAISISQFMEITGLSRQGVVNGIENAVKHGTLRHTGVGKRGIGIYELNVTGLPDGLVNEVDQSTKQTGSSQRSRPVTSQRSRHTKETKINHKESVERKRSSTTLKHGLIDAWYTEMGFSAFDIGADRYQTRRMQCAGKLLGWSIPVTEDEIRAYVKTRKVDTPQYEFTWLESDLAKARMDKAFKQDKRPAAEKQPGELSSYEAQLIDFAERQRINRESMAQS